MSINIFPIGSSSKGNATLITNEKNKILIDCGLNTKTMIEGLAVLGTTVAEIDGILITHSHSDHIISAYELSQNYNIPLYSHRKTLEVLARSCNIKNGNAVLTSQSFSIGSLEIQPFDIPHDDVNPLGYAIRDKNSFVTFATDIGYVNARMMEYCKQSKKIMIESNHDVEMLKNGKYPPFLKTRILSDRGHLSNDDCGAALKEILKCGYKEIILGHLSEQNNLPELAQFSVMNKLKEEGMEAMRDFSLCVAPKKIG